MRRRRLLTAEPPGETGELIHHVAQMAFPLEGPADLDPLLERIGDARYVLLGEASHGTSEYYHWRARISQRLIREKGFSFIAVEGDWPDCYRVNRYVKGFPDVGHGRPRGPGRLRPLADLDVGQRGDRRPGRVAPPAQRRACRTTRRSAFTGWTCTACGSRCTRSSVISAKPIPSALPAARRAFLCFEPYGEDVQRVRPGHGPGADFLRGRGRRLAQGVARQGTAVPRRRPGGVLRRRAERPGASRTPRPTTGPWCGAAPNPGTSATGT